MNGGYFSSSSFLNCGFNFDVALAFVSAAVRGVHGGLLHNYSIARSCGASDSSI